jgi:uncharacterized protein
VRKSLFGMADGGIYDKEEGGFFRYSTTRDWSVPHYEKMCEDNAKFLVSYLEAYQVTGERVFSDAARGILSYVQSRLSDQERGGFYGSQDADEFYYKLSLVERQKREPPLIDRTLFVDWNALMVSAYLLASVVLEDKACQKFALRTVELLLGESFSSKNGMCHYIVDGKSGLSGLLADQVYMVKCLIDSYQVTSDRKFLGYAERLADFMFAKLWDVAGGFYDKPEEEAALGALKLLDKPLEGNSVAADALLRLHHLTGESKYLEAAEKTLAFFVSGVRRYGIMGASYGLATECYLRSMQVHIVGSREDRVTRRFVEETLRAYNPLKVVEVLDPEHDGDRLKAFGYPVDVTPTAYVCFEGTCNSFVDPEKAAEKVGGKKVGE